MFPEGGNYSHEEAVDTVYCLNLLSNNMFKKQTEILDEYKQNNYKSIIQINKSFSKLLRPYLNNNNNIKIIIVILCYNIF